MVEYTIVSKGDLTERVGSLILYNLKKYEKILKPWLNIEVFIDYFKMRAGDIVVENMGGATGHTDNDGSKINFYVNCNARGFIHELERASAHELAHVKRLQELYQSDSLLDRIACEGTAQCFEEYVMGKISPPSRAINKYTARWIWKEIRNKLDSTDFDLYKKIFFTNGDKYAYPLWSGYTISYMIVSKRVKELNMPWDELLAVDSKTLVGNGLD